ncbi:anti-sigma factor [Actinomadura sp. DC4]|uniref:anti-sigma factor n=1 Tax=Actinomadura sp. DC4 TaxID=3055069 RepID=UPI0025B141B0|nr:anti-sigma factor [Actinomadura sp. DC4]MDN3355733.1 anti-sigma factor [Actinomadura sp. DC4]
MSENLHTLAAAYALDSLTEVERRRFETHLTDCDTCADEVRGMRETVTRLATAAAQDPPEALRGRVLAQIARTRQVPPRVARPGSVRARRLGWILSAACLVLAAVLGVATLRAVHTKEHVDALNRDIAAVMAAPDAHRVTGKVGPGGTGTVVASRSLGKAVVVMSGLPPLSSAKTYELWLMGPRPPRPAGTMRPPATGDPGPVLATGLGDATQIGLTVEPAAGSQRPTSPPIFTATLS